MELRLRIERGYLQLMDVTKFEELQLDDRIIRAITEMGFEEASPIQAQAIPVVLEGRDMIGQAQTGTGKTAAFGLPLLQKVDPKVKKLQAVVLLPTRELAIQVAEELRRFAKFMHGIKVLPIYGGQDIVRQIRALKDGTQIVVGTPGRVMDHMRRKTVKMDHVHTVVLDEADEMLNMGFLEDMETILSQLPEERQTLMFSATMPQAIADIAKKFQKEIESDADTFCIMEDNHNNIMSTPPTKMKNPGLFKPFEMYVEMYGLPSYNEIDPTILIGITYSILFGFMFGDAGQGLCLLIGGFLLYKFKKMRLAGIISCCGFFSTIFGVLFGSVFGFEDIIDAVWLRPQEAMTDLPFIGKLNTVFVVAIAIGMGIILLCMILNIINSVKEHNTEKTWFDTNGAAGLVFYFALAAVIVLYMSGNALPATIVLTVLFIIPLLLMFFKEPLSAMVEKKAQKMEGGVGMFITQGVFELFEVLLSYFSNTLSFVRVGAFAVSHAAMMQVVLMLAGAEAGSPNWAVVIGGNLFVCGMEGLIVGIQVLRLEYYEMFSRFYKGTGRKFEPFRSVK